MKVENCQNCGGTHFGQYDCPFDVGPATSKGATGRKTNLRLSDHEFVKRSGKSKRYTDHLQEFIDQLPKTDQRRRYTVAADIWRELLALIGRIPREEAKPLWIKSLMVSGDPELPKGMFEEHFLMCLDENGRCCGSKPIVYKTTRTVSVPQRFCHRCDRAYHLTLNFQIANWAYDYQGKRRQRNHQ